jgi:hypothetical protein
VPLVTVGLAASNLIVAEGRDETVVMSAWRKHSERFKTRFETPNYPELPVHLDSLTLRQARKGSGELDHTQIIFSA